ncbi:patatin-like phospholipase family protein [Paucibacter sp. APW11]|uniref:Patatin-like phospholipase family protein n=1 Tax=Roseateles aquae TaxID=3077235 RepID=A0ABU3PC69_9BURK|nr:patatin-like phospholipase family protein [Paucibacter sp. APW11]MDT9000161.1 patatin-like phospholipase family protein [Paucibacter sp. APW11]
MPLSPLRRLALHTLLGSLCLGACLPARAAEPAPRPRIALVLSGGGARGLAHIGVLRVLQRLQVPVDMVVGTSMGAVVGGAYAAGRSVDELESLVREADWNSILADRPPRPDLSFRRREDDQLLPSRVEFGLSLQGVLLPTAAAGNSALEFTLNKLPPGRRADTPVDRLPLPFQAVATDLVGGQMVVLKQTPLQQTMRASMAVPALFSPVRVEQRLLVDGALVRNLAVDVARAMGAELIIAVNVGSPLLDEQQIQSALSVTDQMVRILTNQNVERSLAELKPQDILITPEMPGIGLTDFSRAASAVEAGRIAAEALQPRLAALALPTPDYERLEAARLDRPAISAAALPLGELRITGTQRSNAEALRAELDLKAGEPLSHAELQQASAQLYGRGEFERIDVQVRDGEGQRVVEMKVTEAAWTNSRLRLGFEVASDFSSQTAYTLSGMHTLSWLNAWGAELRTSAKLGFTRQLDTAWMQPLGPGSAWYVEPSINYLGADLGAGIEGTKIRSRGTTLALGRRLGNWGDLQISTANKRTDVVTKGFASPFNERTDKIRLRVDTLDAPAFPSSGHLVDAWRSRIRSNGSDARAYELKLMRAFRFGDWAGHAYAEGVGAVDSAPTYNSTVLGGFLRLSGSGESSRAAVQAHRFGRLVVARQFGQMPLGLGGAVRVGFSAEAARELPLYDPEDLRYRLGLLPIPQPLVRYAASGFLAIDTRFGPVYLAAGGTRKGGSAVYFFIGPVW